jgi:hypothetical protein
MKNIHVLPTDKPSRLHLGDNGNFVFGMVRTSIESRNNAFTNKHIYITSDEEIKEWDWVISNYGELIKISYKGSKVKENVNEFCKKIILTTDQDLIKDGVQAIDDEFLEWFVKNPTCEYAHIGFIAHNDIREYKIIIPQEEPKQEIELINGFIPTSFFNKQETLEEAAGKLYPLTGEVGIDHRNYLRKEGFINGAKYQAERMYTLEQISKDFIGEEGQSGYFDDWLDYRLDTGNKLSFKEWFEQFKNK